MKKNNRKNNNGYKITGKKIKVKYPICIYFINFKAFIFFILIYPWILLEFLYNILFPYYTL